MASLKDLLRSGLNGECDNPYQYDPFIKGTFFAFLELPSALGIDSKFQDLFARTCLNVSLPTPTIAELEAAGIAGLKTIHPGALSLGNDLPVRLRETYDVDIIKGLSQWHQKIHDWRTGLSQVELRSSNYKGTLKLVITSPTGKYSPIAFKFIGVWPTNDPLNALGADVNDISIAEIDVTFKFDMICPLDQDEISKLIEDFNSNG